MKIYTKKGDEGKTGLIGGTRILKSSLRIEAYGTVDELNSHLGLLRDTYNEQKTIDQILEIQDRLFTLGSHLASDSTKSKMKLPEIVEGDVVKLENWMDEMETELEPMKSFLLPGGHPTVSICHISRCVCRRAERITVDLSQNEEINFIILKYLNRLSDYLFVLSRFVGKKLNAVESPWIPKM